MRKLVMVAMGLLVGVGTVRAAHVVPMTAATLADHAAQVMVGEVVTVRSYWADDPRRIESEVVFQEVTYLKGAGANRTSTRTLIVPGGRVGEMQMRVCCAPVFEAGQRWMLFLLPAYKTFPVVGLYQGAFQIETDAAGVERMFDSAGVALRGIDGDGYVQSSVSARHAHPSPVSASSGLSVAAPALAADGVSAQTYESFVNDLRPILSASRVHVSPETAGRAVVVTHRAVPLRAAGDGTGGDPPRLRTGASDDAAAGAVQEGGDR